MHTGSIIVFWALMAAIAALPLCGSFFFLTIPLYYRIRRIPRPNRTIGFFAKCGFTLQATLLCVTLACGVSAYNVEKDRDDYLRYRGGWNSWRTPLEAPYEIMMRTSMDSGALGIWQNENKLISEIISYTKQGFLVAGKKKTAPVWFLFNCRTGSLLFFEKIEQFHNKCRAAGLPLPLKIETVRHNWYVHWKILEP
ncbi:MAG: hypothetical protein GY868_06515 [Deltaproteobacteria bacterium]|nr:hypothetical protein [Deltaproteobacteria bacterium]